MALDASPPLNVQMVEVRFSDPHGQEACAEVGLNLSQTTASSCRPQRGRIQILEPYGWPPLAPPAP